MTDAFDMRVEIERLKAEAESNPPIPSAEARDLQTENIALKIELADLRKEMRLVREFVGCGCSSHKDQDGMDRECPKWLLEAFERRHM